MVAFVLVSFLADQQQWQFQDAKSTYQKTGKVSPRFTKEDLDRGFVVTGLWSWSRHPNFAAEQAYWLALYQWGCYTTNSTFNWTGLGALAFLILFYFSTWFTELVSSGKYPEYKEYQARVGKFIPRLGTEPVGDWKIPAKAKKGKDKIAEEIEKDAAHARE